MNTKEQTQTSKEVKELFVVVVELTARPDGTIGLGNSVEMPLNEAIQAVKDLAAKSPEHAIGVVPETWLKGKEK